LERAAGALGFSQVERSLRAFAAALWGRAPLLRAIERSKVGRCAPGQYRRWCDRGAAGVSRRVRRHGHSAVPGLHRARDGPSYAHPGALPDWAAQPVQIALVGLVEDARVEALAMRRFPGLRSAVGALPSGGSLSARRRRLPCSHGLRVPCSIPITPTATLSSPRAALSLPPRPTGSPIPRSAGASGSLLGNELGQMRVQFNANTYVVEPIYRDDGLGLWDVDDPSALQPTPSISWSKLSAPQSRRREPTWTAGMTMPRATLNGCGPGGARHLLTIAGHRRHLP